MLGGGREGPRSVAPGRAQGLRPLQVTNAGSHLSARQSLHAWLSASAAQGSRQFMTTQWASSSKQATQASDRPVNDLMQSERFGSVVPTFATQPATPCWTMLLGSVRMV